MTEFNTCEKDAAVTQWIPKLVQQLEKTNNMITHTIDHWIDCVMGGFVTKFAIDHFVSYSEAEKIFFKGPIGKFPRSLKLLINMLMCEKGSLCNHIA